MGAAAPALPAFAIRIGVPEDINFVLTWWRKSEKDATGHLEGRRFNMLHDGMMHGILSRPSTVLTMAHPTNDPDIIAGWLCHRPPPAVLHKGPGRYLGNVGVSPIVYYIFVREECQRLGIAKLLLGDLLDRKDVLYTTRPARVRTHDGWESNPVPIPRHWTYCPRAAFVEVP